MSSHLTTEQIDELLKIAEHNDGHCTTCGQTIKIYTHKVNAKHARILRAMADRTNETQNRQVNFNDIDLAFAEHSQRTKMRQHGLIAKYKEDGRHVASTWVITTKGWSFLKGDPIPAKVIVYNNQVLGHEPETITINRLMDDDIHYEEMAISGAEAKVYNDVRTMHRHYRYYAQFKGKNLSGFDNETVYTIEIDHLKTGYPIKMSLPFEATYPDIAAFQRNWKVLSEIKETAQ